jgi:hypothetical protein
MRRQAHPTQTPEPQAPVTYFDAAQSGIVFDWRRIALSDVDERPKFSYT